MLHLARLPKLAVGPNPSSEKLAMTEIDADLPAYELVSTFLGFPACPDVTVSDADVIIQGIPFDLATVGRAGTREGPRAIRMVSPNLTYEEARWPWTFELKRTLKVEDAGDIYGQTGVPASMVEGVERRTDAILAAGKRVLTLGGDHYVALPLLRSVAKHHGPVSLLHFDAHTDTYKGGDYNHGTMFYHAIEEGLVDPERSVQVGIRTDYDRSGHAFQVLGADWVNNNGPAATSEQIEKVIGEHKVYVSFDIDGLDPAFAPGTGTPVVGGMTTSAALQIIRSLVDLDVVGMDLVEVSPPYDQSDITALAGATLCLDMLYVWGDRNRRGLL